MKQKNAAFENATLMVAGNEYHNCKLLRCTIVYDGTGGVGFSNCEFNGCKWKLTGPAAATIKYLQALYQVGGDGAALVESLFDAIRTGKDMPKGVITH